MRAALIVADPASWEAALECGADALIAEAAAGPPPAAHPALYLRLPALDEDGALDALKAAAALRPRGVAAPLASGAEAQRLGARLAVEEARLGLEDGALKILAFATESPEAIFGLPSYRGASSRLVGLVCAVAPLAAALRAERRDAGPLRLARDLMLIAARAAGILALDAPYADADDLDGLRAEARAARADGFDGKLALSAAQAGVIDQAFA